MKPGETALTRMPYGARSRLAALTSPITAAFEAAYAGMFGAPFTPAVEAVATIEPPPPPATIDRAAAATTLKAPRALTSSTRRATAAS